MNMVDIMWLFCGAFIGGLITLFFTAMLNISHEKAELEQARRKIEALEEDKRALRIALKSPTSPEKEGYTDKVKLLRQGEKAFNCPESKRIKRQCAVCGHRYNASDEFCPVCGQKSSFADAAVLDGLSREEVEVAKGYLAPKEKNSRGLRGEKNGRILHQQRRP